MNGASVYVKSLVTILACALLFCLISIPLIQRKISRNGLYGFRTTKSLSSDQIWYDVNAYFGKAFLISNLTTAIAMIVLYSIRQQLPLEYFMQFSTATLIIPSVIAVVFTFIYLHTISEKP